MAIMMFLKLADLKGESTDDRHKDEIDVLAWNWGMTQPGTTHVGSGGGAGKVSVNDLSITKYIDRSSPILIISCCSGKHFAEGVLTVRKAGENALEYLKISIRNVLVTSISTNGSSGEEDRFKETVTLNFAEFKVEYTPQKADGSGDTPIAVGWDIAANAPR
jgi:type VI secretion system secreted protein Hcp